MNEQNDIEAAFAKWWRNTPYPVSSKRMAWIAYTSGAIFGLEKAASVYRGINADLSDEGLNKRLAASNVPELVAADARRVDVTA